MVRIGTAILIAMVAWAALAGEHHARAESLPEMMPDFRRPEFPQGEFPPPRRRAPQFSRERFHPRDSLETSAGYIFLNGKYIEPPYRITARDNKIEVNGQVTDIELPATPPRGAGAGYENPGRRRRPPGFMDRVPPQFIQLQYGSVVVLFENSPPVAFEFGSIGKRFLKAINDPARRASFFAEDGGAIPAEEHDHWQE